MQTTLKHHMKLLNINNNSSGTKKILVKELPNKEIPDQFYVKDWRGLNRNDLYYFRYTKTKNGWRYKNFFIKDDSDFIEIEIPYSKFQQITASAN
jgi:hypothetical protein